jgi:hypothetical protein
LKGLLAAFAALLALAPAAHAGGSSMALGAAEDTVRSASLVESEAAMSMIRLAGFRAVRVTSTWQPGLSAPTEHEAAVLSNVAAAASMHGVRVFVSVYHAGSRTTPLTPGARKEFASYVTEILRANPSFKDVIVGNEPNLNRFWMPQFDAEGNNVAAPAYLALLIAVHDAVKQALPEVRIWGGALAPRGIDRPNTGRDTHSPTTFIEDLGAAYRVSGRDEPPMDGFAYHPYPASSSDAPDEPTNPASSQILMADYEEKLRPLLDEAFGPGLPVLYSELGVETTIPPAKALLYEGEEPGKPVDEATQADYYRRAIELAACQDGVEGLLLFHSQDEPALAGFQSGVHYVDGTPKESLEPVRDAIESTMCP